MANAEKVLVRVPASTANMGPGFDTLGMALNLYAWIEMAVADKNDIALFGDELRGVPADESNLVFQVAQRVFREAGIRMPSLSIAMYSDIPLTRGLGSSASAIVGAMAAANALAGSPLTADDMFQIATRMEDHPDNVGASLFGGIVVAQWDGRHAWKIRIEPHARLEVLAVIPEFHLSTEKARQALPGHVTMKDAVFNVAGSSLLVAALASGELPMIRHAMRDVLHQPYRAALIPGMQRILAEAPDHGALGAALSGAGPTLLAFADSASCDKRRLERFMLDAFAREGVTAKALWLKPDRHGVQILTSLDGNSTFIDNIRHIKGEVRA